jgi:preprotein translocase subunit SecG
MLNVILVIHLLIAIALVGVILLQRSEGGALGIGGGGGGGLMTGRAAGNLLTRATAILAGAFFITSMGLALLANEHTKPSSLMLQEPAGMAQPAKPAEPAKPAAPQEPTAPISK